VHFGLIADVAILDNPRSLADRFGSEFEQLLLATTVGLLGTRPAARPRRGKPARVATPAAD
jgi:hypothetical protein